MEKEKLNELGYLYESELIKEASGENVGYYEALILRSGLGRTDRKPRPRYYEEEIFAGLEWKIIGIESLLGHLFKDTETLRGVGVVVGGKIERREYVGTELYGVIKIIGKENNELVRGGVLKYVSMDFEGKSVISKKDVFGEIKNVDSVIRIGRVWSIDFINAQNSGLGYAGIVREIGV